MIEFRRPGPPREDRAHAFRSSKFFSSVKLAIVLIILITLASVLGTLHPPGPERRPSTPPATAAWPGSSRRSS
ncbi:MAG: cytochrome c biogenesis protein ResB [Candidatus Moduliflexus flocculans]|nr:cytochrome c biogenesis protein ResB [Candidatus Moduliflexus flocculans]